MEILGIDHIGVVTKSIEESSAFYREYMGFTQGEVLEVKEMGMKILYLKKGSDTIELLEPDAKEGSSFGLKHLAFLCRGIDQVLEEASKRNLKVLHKSPMRHGDMRFFFCKAPDGELIEFVEREER